MAERFIGRKEELDKLQELISMPHAIFTAVYGRRQVGKTFLVDQLPRIMPQSIYIRVTTDIDTTNRTNLMEAFSAIAVLSPDTHGVMSPPNNWKDFFKRLELLLNGYESTAPVILFFDEFPWFDKQKSGFYASLIDFWEKAKNSFSFFNLIASGSATHSMLRYFEKNTGKGAFRWEQIQLAPFKLSEVRDYFQANSLKHNDIDIVALYQVMGGMPGYLKFVNNQSPDANINRLCFGKHSKLLNELPAMMSKLFSHQGENHFNVLKFLSTKAFGASRSDIRQALGLPESTTTITLRDLKECAFIEEIDSIEKTRSKFYRVIDLLTIFHFTWIEGNESLIKTCTNYWSSRSQGNFCHWRGHSTEIVCYLHSDKIAQHLGIDRHLKAVINLVQRDKNGISEIDLVLSRKDNMYYLVEIKHKDQALALTADLKTKIERKENRFRSVTRSENTMNVLVSITGFTDEKSIPYFTVRGCDLF